MEKFIYATLCGFLITSGIGGYAATKEALYLILLFPGIVTGFAALDYILGGYFEER